MTLYVYSALAWSGAGFALGWLTCWVAVRAAAADDVVRDGGGKVRVSRLDTARVIIGVLILSMVLLTGVRYYQFTTCQSEYNEVVAEALVQRSEAQRQEGLAQIELLTASLSGDRVAGVRETREYIEAVRELERVRASTPLPGPPNCGEFR